MMDSMTRRQLLFGAGWRALLDDAVQTLRNAATTMPRAENKCGQGGGPFASSQSRGESATAWYFASPLISYPLLQEIPMEMLLMEAQKRGVPTEGRSKNDIAADVFLRAGV